MGIIKGLFKVNFTVKVILWIEDIMSYMVFVSGIPKVRHETLEKAISEAERIYNVCLGKRHVFIFKLEHEIFTNEEKFIAKEIKKEIDQIKDVTERNKEVKVVVKKRRSIAIQI